MLQSADNYCFHQRVLFLMSCVIPFTLFYSEMFVSLEPMIIRTAFELYAFEIYAFELYAFERSAFELFAF